MDNNEELAPETSDNADKNEPQAAPATEEQPDNGSTTGFDYAGYSREHQAFLKAKGYKNVPALIDSYRALEKKIGSSVAVPNETDSAETWETFYKKIGAPDTVEGYGIKADSQMRKDLLTVAAKLHLDKRRTLSLIELAESDFAAETAQEQEQFNKECDELFESWGEHKAANLDLITRGRGLYNVSDSQYREIAEILGVKATAGLFLNIGRAQFDGVPSGKTAASGEMSLGAYLYSKRTAHKN